MGPKKLLILGANPETIAIVQIAQKMGIYTIVTDYNPSAPAKKYADKSYNVDGTDVETLFQLAQEEQVDGVLVGVADLLVRPYQELCEKLNLPCYASKKALDVFSNKYVFKRFFEEYGVKGVPETTNCPVLVKPVDNCSGQGITICYSNEELDSAIDKAKSFSRSGKYLTEKYMTCDDILLYYTFKNGECFLSAIADRNTLKIGQGSPVNLGSIYPSKYTNFYMDKFHYKMKQIFSDLNVENGVLLIQAFIENNELYVYDPGFRLQGEGTHFLLNAINGFDQREMLIYFSLTGDMGISNFADCNDYLFKGKHAATLWFLLNKGKIQKIEGIQSDPRIIQVSQRLNEGDIVTDSMLGTEKQVFSRFYIVCDTKKELDDFCLVLRKQVRVIGENGENLVLNPDM